VAIIACEDQKIRVNQELPRQMVASKVVHELLHGGFYTSGIQPSADEEHIVDPLANALCQQFRDNQKLWKWILRSFEDGS
jgi:hypothetical protein